MKKQKLIPLVGLGLFLTLLFILITLGSGCSTARGRFLLGAGLGGVVTGATAMALSPNSASVPLNGVVFGLGGALAGGIGALLLMDDSTIPSARTSLKTKEQATASEYTAPYSGAFPAFVKDRLQPVVIEENLEADSVSEDGSLHEPHKVYRIKRPAELFARPTKTEAQNRSTP
ncbi:hypothetical protein WDW37_16500 [Bdellovibrionota bacterium FG-1]